MSALHRRTPEPAPVAHVLRRARSVSKPFETAAPSVSERSETPPPRSPERQRLFDARLALSAAEGLANRIEAARQKLDDRLYDQLQPAVRVAQEQLDEARQAAPSLLADAALNDKSGTVDVARAEARLAKAKAAVDEAHQAKRVLREEAERAEIQIGMARQKLDAAVTDAVKADPARQAVLDEYDRAARRALDCARVLRTLSVNPVAEAHGLRLIIGIAPVSTGATTFVPDSVWVAALAALRLDPDQPLPGLPAEDDPAGNVDAARAA